MSSRLRVLATRAAEPAVVVALLLALLVQAGAAIERTSLTYDEHLYLPAGYTYWMLGDFRLSREHPPLTKLVAALPLIGMQLRMDASRRVFDAAPRDESTWAGYDFGETFLFDDNLARFDEIVRAGRRAMLVFPLILALVTWLWSRELFGRVGGAISLALVAFNPDVLGHGGLVTNDIAMAAGYVACAYLAWRCMRQPTRGRVVGLGVALGLSLATKYSALLLLPVLGVMLAAHVVEGPARRLLHGEAGERRERFALAVGAAGRLGAWIAAVLAVAAAAVWATYLFTESPLAYVRGMRHVYALAVPGFESFLLGEYKLGRFWDYFLVALGLKVPLATLGLAAWGVVEAVRRRAGPWLLDAAALVVPPVALFVAMTLTAMQIGHRYVFGVLPFLFIAAGAASPHVAALARRLAGRGVVVVGLVASAIVSGVAACPWYLSYANALVSSPLAFFDDLDAANNDWQQGWREVARLQRRGELGTVAIYVPELESRRLAPYAIRHATVDLSREPAPGTYLSSAFRWARGRHDMDVRGVRYPLFADHRPSRVIAGCVVQFDVPGTRAAPLPPAALELREQRATDGRLVSRHHVARDATGAEVREGAYERHDAQGRLEEEGEYHAGKLHGRYVRWHPNGVKAEEGHAWQGQLHGRVTRWDESGRVLGTWEYWQGARVGE